MANKNIAKKLIASAQSLAANFTTAATNIDNLDSIAWSVSTSSVTDNTGTFTFQVRTTDAGGVFTGDWIDLTFNPAPTLANANATLYCFATALEATEARLKFTAAGGSPNGTAQITVKASRRG